MDVRDIDGKRINYLIDIKDIRIDDISVVSVTNHNFLSVSHDKLFSLPVMGRKGQIIPVIFKYDVHHYEYTEFRNLLSQLMTALK